MATRSNVVSTTSATFKLSEQGDQRLKIGVEKFREALEQDAKNAASRKSGLPRDWRSRILK